MSAALGDLILPSRDEASTGQREGHDWSDLGARIASSLVLATVGLAGAYFGGPWLAAVCGAAVVAMSYEWARMSEPEATQAAFVFALAGSLGAVLFSSWRHLDYGVAWLAVCLILSALRRRTLTGVIETVGGALYIGLPCALFLWLRNREPDGLETIVALFAIIWASDVFAYFGGKLIGGPKVAVGLSPNKTWSGIVSGALAGALAGYGCGYLFQVPASLHLAWLSIGLVVGFTGLMGDLFESFLKRRFGVKDASRLIPGHGGVLDRIDSLIAATILVGAVLAFGPPSLSPLFGAGL
ncbi:MAG: CDP-archaeol synthase [Hyphomonadaceae bacterium]|nr:CDP-archaeol synthase [Hyphomonadaceae bacterium]